MAWKKRDFITEAFSLIGLASYTYDMQPEQWQTSLSTLDRMMALWNSRGMRVGYPLPSGPDSSALSDVCDVPDIAVAAIVPGLAVLLCPIFGKAVPMDLAATARETRRALSIHCTPPADVPWSGNVPAGAGNSSGYYVNLPAESALLAGQDSTLSTE